MERIDTPTLVSNPDLTPEVDAAPALDCAYRNSTDRMVIVRCCGPQEFFLERVVFPFELLSFLCPPASEVEIWTHGMGGPELVEATRAEDLCLSVSSLGGGAPLPPTPWLQAS